MGSSLLLTHLLMKMKNMAGPLQIQYPGAWDHVINNRGRIGGIVFKNKVVKNRIPNKHIEKLKQEVKVSQEQTCDPMPLHLRVIYHQYLTEMIAHSICAMQAGFCSFFVVFCITIS